jgi:peptidoglycan/xylan/chitin deacetylase (PgdA/CDA1 family)
MRFLAARRTPVSLGRLLEALDEGRDLPARSVVVTFDDGYLDHFTVAAPILVNLRIPATFFLPTGYVSRAENQWVDRLYSAFRHRTRHEFRVDDTSYDLSRAVQARQAFQRLQGVLLKATCPERDLHLRRVEDQLKPEGSAPRLTMNWNEARQLLKLSPDFEIGGHSRDHLDVSAMSEADAQREIAACAGDLRRELGDAARDFSFPYERWTPAAQNLVRAEGFRSALGMGPEVLISHRSDRFALPRLDPVSFRSTFGFVTSGAHPALSRALTGRA